MPVYINYQPNQKINGLILLEEIESHTQPSGQIQRKALFKCYCGNKFESRICSVKNNNTKSCGCLIKKGGNKTHGLSAHCLCPIWREMVSRCHNRKNKDYKNYGDRGVSVCEEWRDNFESFYNWALKNGYKGGLTIDRRNNNGNYEPANCRFITKAENSRNKRGIKLNWDLVNEIRNIKLLIPEISPKEIAVAYNVKSATIRGVLCRRSWVI